MRRFPLSLVLAGLTALPAHALAQPASVSDAQQAAEAARAAANAAEQAARAARAAADAAERALRAASPAGESGALVATPADAPSDENVSVAEVRNRLAGAERQAFRAGVAQGVANGPNDRVLRNGLSPEVQITATTADKMASLAWTMDVSGAPQPNQLGMTLFTITATSSLNSQNEAQIVGLRGFPGGAEVKLNFTHYMAGFRPSATERPQVARARLNCRAAKREQGIAEAEIVTLCNPYTYANGVGRFVADFNPTQYRQLLEDVLPGHVYFFGGEATLNQTDFSYLDQPNFTMQEVSRFGYTGTVFGGAIFNSGLTSLTGSFTYGRRYRGQDPITLCQPINAIPQSRCITAAAGPPKRRTQAILAVELRHAFGAAVGEFADVAIAPEFSIDLENDSYSLDVPLYLIGDADGRLRGGLRFGYVNSPRDGGGRDDDFSLGLFVGVPFSVFR